MLISPRTARLDSVGLFSAQDASAITVGTVIGGDENVRTAEIVDDDLHDGRQLINGIIASGEDL